MVPAMSRSRARRRFTALSPFWPPPREQGADGRLSRGRRPEPGASGDRDEPDLPGPDLPGEDEA